MGDNVDFRQSGLLKHITSLEEEDFWRDIVEKTRSTFKLGDESVQYLDREAMLKQEPHCGENVIGGVYYPRSGHIHPKKFTREFGRLAEKFGTLMSLH